MLPTIDAGGSAHTFDQGLMRIDDFIERHRDRIVDVWYGKVEALMGGTLTHDQVLDSLHLFMNEMLLGLRAGRSTLEEGKSAMAREHGSQRQVMKVPLPSLIREYILFLDSVHDTARAVGEALSADDCVALARLLATGAAEAADQFVERQAQERAQADYQHFAFLAHELRNPLSSAKMGWDLLRRRCDGGDARIAESVSAALNRLSDVIDDSLVDVKLRTSDLGVDLRREDVDVRQLVVEAQGESLVDAEARGIQMRVEGAAVVIPGDRRVLRSVFTNLVRNAVKFTRRQGAIVVRVQKTGGWCNVSVEDECGGLAPGQGERVFEAFSQMGKDRSGYGLGLAITKQAVEAHGGTVRVTNRPPLGCTFTVDLPLP